MSRAPRLAGAKRDWGSDDSRTPILHVDMDAFFASVEVRDNPALAGLPVIVGGRQRGVVAAASYEARVFGVRSAMPMTQALSRCPGAIVVPPRKERYSEVSAQVMSVLTDITPVVEKVSVDEAFLDVGGAVRRLGSPAQIAAQLRREVVQRVGVTASVGIASTKLVAKLASTHAKPDGLMLVPPQAVQDFLGMLPAGALPGVGERTGDVLDGLGVRTVADLRGVPVSRLQRSLGVAHARHLQAMARGEDPRPVTVHREEKSVGTETTFAQDITELPALDRVLLRQCHQTAARLRAEGLAAAGVAIKVRHHDFTTLTRSRALPAPTFLAAEFYAPARALLHALALPAGGIRLLGMRAERLQAVEFVGVQGGLDDDGGGERIERTLDDLTRKFGPLSVAPASLLDRRQKRWPPDGALDAGDAGR